MTTERRVPVTCTRLAFCSGRGGGGQWSLSRITTRDHDGYGEHGVRRSRAEWQALLERAERSRLSTVAFCAAEGISTASFYLWRKRLRAMVPVASDNGSSATAFLDLGVLSAPRPDEPSWDLELDLGAGVVLRLRRG
ncbi:hypothetical protein ABC977_08900 [Thioalkalicoccus limnaeus]|uniref:Transposase n=1 Tax=Thioalkalicoccus limnaeus TaxID=120681 RepID=A0ABV4BDC2_9GAMM